MVLPTGTITMNQVNVEMGFPGTTSQNLNSTAVRRLAQDSAPPTSPFLTTNTTISMNDLRGKTASVKASGATTTVDIGTRRYNIFTAPGTYTVNYAFNGPPGNAVDYLVVAGGGGAGATASSSAPSGGGGAGGVRIGTLTVTATTYSVSIGGGGAGGNSTPGDPSFIGIIGGQGSPSTFGPISANAGGGGGASTNTATTYNQPTSGDPLVLAPNISTPYRQGRIGGSGGGGGTYPPGALLSSPGGAGNQVAPTSPPQGNPGGSSIPGGPGPNYGGAGGGGGAGGAGNPGSPGPTCGDGGSGVTAPWLPSSLPVGETSGGFKYFGGGGGGGGGTGTFEAGNGGLGGGGDGVEWGGPASPRGYVGFINTGGGGGGLSIPGGPSGPGGSGVVIISYTI